MAKKPIAVLGIDLGKNSCSVAGLDTSGAVVLRRRMTRESLVAFADKLPACIVAMEACCGAHFLGRTFAAQGHTVRLMSPEYVQPYVKSQKTDDRDAEAIAEAATRPTMRARASFITSSERVPSTVPPPFQLCPPRDMDKMSGGLGGRWRAPYNDGGGISPAACFRKTRAADQKEMIWPTMTPWPCQVLLFLLKLPWAVPFRLLPALKLLLP
jgi:hypothetical protein